MLMQQSFKIGKTASLSLKLSQIEARTPGFPETAAGILNDIQLDSTNEEAYSKDIITSPGKVLIPFSRHIHPMPFGFSSKTMN